MFIFGCHRSYNTPGNEDKLSFHASAPIIPFVCMTLCVVELTVSKISIQCLSKLHSLINENVSLKMYGFEN